MRLEAIEQPVRVPSDAGPLDADLALPPGAAGLVLFAHGSGSGRRSPRNRQVAEALVARGFGTLLLDLLTASEAAEDERTARLRFDIGLLAGRVCAALDFVAGDGRLAGLRTGLFGASTGAAAALIAGATRPERVAAVVSRGGRPDLAGDALARVQAPTLLIVGGADPLVLELNRDAQQQMPAPTALEIVPGAGHLFEEPGAMAEVVRLTAAWLERYVAARCD
jgi:putative phosphoribosyl transferase